MFRRNMHLDGKLKGYSGGMVGGGRVAWTEIEGDFSSSSSASFWSPNGNSEDVSRLHRLNRGTNHEISQRGVRGLSGSSSVVVLCDRTLAQG